MVTSHMVVLVDSNVTARNRTRALVALAVTADDGSFCENGISLVWFCLRLAVHVLLGKKRIKDFVLYDLHPVPLSTGAGRVLALAILAGEDNRALRWVCGLAFLQVSFSVVGT
jgi:hypothetical protein